MAEQVFVYGTLKNGSGVEATIHGELWDLQAFPAVIKAGIASAGVVEGEIREIDEKELKIWDGYEGVASNFYRRIKVMACDFEGNELMEVWVYEFCNSNTLHLRGSRCGTSWDRKKYVPRSEREND